LYEVYILIADNNHITKRNPLPWWTWVLPLFIFFAGTQISLWSKVATGSSLFYFPGPLALILVYWWGPRVLLPYYINSALCAGFWGLDRVELWPVYALPEVVFAFLSWLLFIKMANGQCWLPNIRQTIYFLIGGILIPLVIYKFLLEAVFLMAGDIPQEKFWHILVTTGLGDFISMFGLSVPVLYFLTRKVSDAQLLYFNENIPDQIQPRGEKLKSTARKAEIIFLVVLVGYISTVLNFVDYWFIYGVISLYVAIRFGFGTTLAFNSYILIATYILPAVFETGFNNSFILDDEKFKTQLGSALLFVFSAITGRVITDNENVEKKLSEQNQELEQTNQELDRFVYSVSHDLSAPLKSILGLVNIGRLTKDSDDQLSYFAKIESSVRKLEVFINEVLDYSKNKRLDTVQEQFKLKDLCTEILDNLKYIEEFRNVKIDLNGLADQEITNDKTRLKIILNNILTNAVKYQKRIPGHQHLVKVSSLQKSNKFLIDIEDNGEGIHPDVQAKIFNMFFRGHHRSNGSGLGLYIAKEAAEKIGGNISVRSEYGKGATFTLELNNPN
jgi:signal transduction histidine kinase